MKHGDKSFEIVAPRSRFREGGFGRLFPDLDPWVPLKPDGSVPKDEEELKTLVMDLAREHMIEPSPADTTADSTLPAGYTYFGQFVDHDITLDLTPLSEQQVDPNRLHNFRTPRLDLDCLYGLGPGAQPYLYEPDGAKFRIGRVFDATTADGVETATPTQYQDLPRLSVKAGEQQTALIGDPRNDENTIVAQLHLVFLLAHNELVGAGASFGAARKTLTWLYQWVVWNDYLKRICNTEIWEAALRIKTSSPLKVWEAGFKDVFNWKNSPFMPVEFSAAAYRFGHSLVRDGYRTNNIKGAQLADAIRIFSDDDINLRGFRALRREQVVQWDWFVQMESSFKPSGFPQRARKFDTHLAPALRHLPEDKENPADDKVLLNVLAARNLLRGIRLQLPSGPDVARLLNVPVTPLEPGEPEALWYYILKEAETTEGGQTLGKVGSIIVAATFAGLLLGDSTSFFNLEPGWTPDADPLLSVRKDALTIDGGWTLASVIRLSGVPVSREAFPSISA